MISYQTSLKQTQDFTEGGWGDGREASGPKTNFWVMAPQETPESIKHVGQWSILLSGKYCIIKIIIIKFNFDAGGMDVSPRLSPLITPKMKIVNKSNIFTVVYMHGLRNKRYTYLWYFRMRQVEDELCQD